MHRWMKKAENHVNSLFKDFLEKARYDLMIQFGRPRNQTEELINSCLNRYLKEKGKA